MLSDNRMLSGRCTRSIASRSGFATHAKSSKRSVLIRPLQDGSKVTPLREVIKLSDTPPHASDRPADSVFC